MWVEERRERMWCVCARVQGRLGVVVRRANLVPMCLGLKPSCVTMGRSLNLSFLQFPPLKNGDDDDDDGDGDGDGDDTSLTGWLWDYQVTTNKTCNSARHLPHDVQTSSYFYLPSKTVPGWYQAFMYLGSSTPSRSCQCPHFIDRKLRLREAGCLAWGKRAA